MYVLHIFTFAITVFLFVDALPYEQPKVHTIPLNIKSTTRRRAYNVTRRALEHMTINQDPPDVAYFGKITFGTGNPQEFDILFDTGSAELFVITEYCKSPACQNKPKYYTNSDVSLEISPDRLFNSKYYTGNAEGLSGTTTIKIGSFPVEMQDFGLVDVFGDGFINYPFSGIMGMALSSASENGQLTPITNLINNGVLDKPQFSFMLGRHADNMPSELTIGGNNIERYNVDLLTWTNLVDNNKGLWSIPLENCFVNGQPLNIQDRTATIDTGTSVVILPHGDAKLFYSNIPNSEEQYDGTFSIPCDTNIVIGLTFSGMTWNMNLGDFVIREGPDYCVGSFEAGKTESDTQWHIGSAFLKNVYTIFDQGGFRVGFSSLKQP